LDPVARRMRTSRDVVFDESRHFYPHPTTDAPPASLVDPLSFLFFPDAHPASLPLPYPTLPTSVSSAESSPVVPDYTVNPPVTQVYNHRGARLSEVPTSSAELSAVVVTAAGFSASTHDPALFVHVSPRGMTLLLLYVDDMIITGDDPEYIAFVKAHLSDQFLMSDLNPLRYFLRIEISSTS
jgi:hypothetical protein